MDSSQSKTPAVVGIDLGTTYCALAYVKDSGDPQTIVNGEGDLTTPSAVLIEDDEVVVGRQAIKAMVTIPENVATFAKRDIGKPKYSRKVDGRSYRPEEIQSIMLKRLKEDAEQKLGRSIESAVITVPAYFNEPKRRSTIESSRMAGLRTLAIINEPTAAAIAYGLETQSRIMGPQKVLIYDLGGGTFDATLVHVEGNEIRVIATDGNAMLGGGDWDKCLAKWLDQSFHRHSDFLPSATASGKTWLLQEAVELKHALTSREEIKVRLSYQGHQLQTLLDRKSFDEMTAHLLDRTRFTIRKLLKESEMTWNQIDQVVLVGGATRMPQVRTMIGDLAGMEPNFSVSADEAVAHGAALLAQSLSKSTLNSDDHGESSMLSVTDVNAHNLGVLGVDVKTQLRCNHVMIARNTSLPAKKTTRFQTVRKNQHRVVVEVIEGGDARGRYGTHIGRCILGGLPPDLPAGAAVDVTFQYDRDGLIRVEARLPGSGQTAEIHIERNSANISSDSVSDLESEWSIDS